MQAFFSSCVTLVSSNTAKKDQSNSYPIFEMYVGMYSYVSIKNSYRIIVLLKGFSKINKNSVLNKSSESEKELLI